MQKIFINHPGAQDGRPPFWMPWGCGGCLWRSLVFLSSLFLLLFLMSRCHSCSTSPDANGGNTPFPIDTTHVERPAGPDSVFHMDPTIEPLPSDSILSDETSWLPEHPGGTAPTPELPADSANQIAPIDNPVRDSLGMEVNGNVLNVLISLKQRQTMEEEMIAWAKKFKRVYRDQSYQVCYYNPLTCFMQITIPEDQRVQVKAEINGKMPEFDFIVFDEGVMGPNLKPNDPALYDTSCNWWHQGVQLYEAWDITMGDPNIVIGVVDSYFDLRHPEFRTKRIIAPICLDRMNGDRTNLLPPDGIPIGPAIHGSHVLSCAAATANNGEGLSGIAPKCSIIPVSVADIRAAALGGGASSLRIAEGILYCILHGAHVVNCSMGSPLQKFAGQSEDVQVALAQIIALPEEKVWDYVFRVANRRNCMIVFAAGNEGVVSGIDPMKRNLSTIRVSACGHELDSVGFTNYGLLPELGVNYSTVSMPGVDIVGAAPNNKYMLLEGTSMAAPLVAGVVALMKSLDPTLTNDEVINILIETGKPQPQEQHIGPLVQIKDALERVQTRHPQMSDILNDPSQLEGLWECRSSLLVASTDEPVTLYLKLEAQGRGTVFSITSNNVIHEAPVSWNVDVEAQKVEIRSITELQCPQDRGGFKKIILVGTAGQNGRMQLIGHHEEDDPNDPNKTFNCDMAFRNRLTVTCEACGETKNY